MAEDPSIGNWLPDVILAFREAGGTAEFPQIYRWIQSNRRQLPEEWKATVRGTVYHYSSDSTAFKEGNPDVFLKKGRGLWALRYPLESVSGKKLKTLILEVLHSMTKEELESFSGKRDEFFAFLNQQVEAKRRKFKIH